MDKSKTQYLLEKIPLLAGLVMMLVAAGVYKLGFSEPEALLPWMLAGIAGIAGDLLIYRFSRDKEKETMTKSMSEVKQALTNIEQTYTTKIRSIKAPSGPSGDNEYIELWGGFETDVYSAFNPAYRIEPLESNRDKMVEEVFVRRFQSKDFKEARYLFFLKDDKDLEDYEIFRDIMKKAKDKCPEIGNKLSVKVIDQECADDYPEFYVGRRRGEDTCIIEPAPADKILGNEQKMRGFPHYYFVTNDSDLCRQYNDWFNSKFQHKSARRVNLNEIFSQNLS
jgi:hypothetical protein